MSILNKFSEGYKNITESAKYLGKKSGEILEVTKIKMEVSKLEKEIDNNYQVLGNLVYHSYAGHSIPNIEEEINRLCIAITNLNKDIQKLREEIEKNQPYSIQCQYCGKNVPVGSNFCPACGKSTASSTEIVNE